MTKYVYEFVIQGLYESHGWEDLVAESKRREAKARLREYRRNDDVARDHRIVIRRTLRKAGRA